MNFDRIQGLGLRPRLVPDASVRRSTLSLLGDIQKAIVRWPEVKIVGIDYRHVFGNFNTHVFRIAPATVVDHEEQVALFARLVMLVPQEPSRILNFFDLIEHARYGELIYKEEIGTEKVVRVFTVDDVTHHTGREFSAGRQEPETRTLTREINVMLYPTEQRAWRGSYGLTVFKPPIIAA